MKFALYSLALASPVLGKLHGLRGEDDSSMTSNMTSKVGTSSYLSGIDVSHYQGTINWETVAASGVSFSMAKATEGTGYSDPTFATNYQGMLDAGMIRGAYHYAQPESDAATQAQFFVSTVRSAGGFNGTNTMQLVLDLEDSNGLGTSAVWSWVQEFVSSIKSLTGRPPIIYTGYYFWRDNVGNPTDNLDCPLWIAAYSSSPSIPDAWSSVGWAFWQYNDNGAIPGISGDVDVDYFANSATYPSIEALCYP